MKSINKIVVLLFIVSVVSSCGSAESHNEAASTEMSTENLMAADYAIKGMVCAMGCAATIEKDVAGMDGVSVSNVDYEAEKAHFEFDVSRTSEKEIIAKIESIADGQYKVGAWVEGAKAEEVLDLETEDEGTESNNNSIVEVSLPSFKIPNLLTLLLDQI